MEGWPDKVKNNAKKLIGKSYGCEINFEIKDQDEIIGKFFG